MPYLHSFFESLRRVPLSKATPCVVVLATIPLIGCRNPADGSGGIESDPQATAAEVMQLYDSNQDNALDEQELKASLALASATDRFDTNGNGRISTEELVARFEQYKVLSTHMAGQVVVVDRRRPVANAKVTLEPEPFMGSAVPTYRGTTNQSGEATMTSEPRTPGFVVGFYKVQVQQSDGKESQFGCEIIDDSEFGREIRFDVGK